MKQKEFGLYGIFGYPAAHTLSPGMQEAAFEAAGLKAFYLALELRPRDFKKVMRGISKLVLDGFNVTVPYKQTVTDYLDGLSPEARAIGAVNTVFRKNGRWLGANTDAYGFWASLVNDGKFRPRGKKALVLGAGGAARAVVYALGAAGIKKIAIANRHQEKAKTLTREFRRRFKKITFEALFLKPRETEKAVKEADLVVNTTSVGMKARDPRLLWESQIPQAGGRKKLFFDLIYHVDQTPFLKAAKRKGHRILNGLGMLLFQGAKAFELWTAKKAPVAMMRRALLDGLKGRDRA